MNLAGVIILYYPDAQLAERIITYKKYLKKLYIMDNTEVFNEQLLSNFQQDPTVHISHSGENRGMSERLNEAIHLAIRDGFDWLLTMDQDSYFDTGVFDQYLSCFQSFGEISKVAVFGIEYDQRELKGTSCYYKSVDQVITSGSLMNLSLFDEIGAFDEALFIDNVDHEFCYRAKVKGFEIIKVQNLLLSHSLGVLSEHRSLKNLKKTIRTLHSPIRLYYMVRNYLYIKPKYAHLFKEDFRIIQKNLYYSIKNNLLYSKRRSDVLKYIFKGIFDYKKGRMGKLK